MTRDRFRKILAEAIDQLPQEFREATANLTIVVEDEPSDEQIESVGLDPELDTLFGLYEGVPLPERHLDDSMQLPDRITIYYRPLVDAFGTPAEIREEIRVTLVHELAHYFGLEEDEIDRLGYD